MHHRCAQEAVVMVIIIYTGPSSVANHRLPDSGDHLHFFFGSPSLHRAVVCKYEDSEYELLDLSLGPNSLY